MMRSTIGSQPILHGDWRRRQGTKTDAHLWAPVRRQAARLASFANPPLCGKRIPRGATVAVHSGVPCADCLIAAIRRVKL